MIRRIEKMERRTENVLELTIHAPMAAKHFQPGQFYRLQNYETFSQHFDHTSLQMEPLALIGADVDRANGNLKFIVIENGVSSKICSTFRINEPISLMGPTGVRAKIAAGHETVLIVGNQLSIALLTSYGKALKHAGNRVIYLGHFDSANQVYNKEILEQCADAIIWTTASGKPITAIRTQDYSAEGNAFDALHRYAQGKLDSKKTQPEISLGDVDRVYVIGNSDFLRTFQEERENRFKEFFIKNPRVFGSVYSTMQCMLKGVCAQCLQWQIDPETGKRTKAVFACSWQDQPLELIDFDNMHERQIQNHLQEKLSNLWVDYLFQKFEIERL